MNKKCLFQVYKAGSTFENENDVIHHINKIKKKNTIIWIDAETNAGQNHIPSMINNEKTSKENLPKIDKIDSIEILETFFYGKDKTNISSWFFLLNIVSHFRK